MFEEEHNEFGKLPLTDPHNQQVRIVKSSVSDGNRPQHVDSSIYLVRLCIEIICYSIRVKVLLEQNSFSLSHFVLETCVHDVSENYSYR